MEIPCSEKSAMSETSNFWITFFYVFLKVASKQRKKSRFWIFKKNVKNVFSNYASTGIMSDFELLEEQHQVQTGSRNSTQNRKFSPDAVYWSRTVGRCRVERSETCGMPKNIRPTIGHAKFLISLTYSYGAPLAISARGKHLSPCSTRCFAG